MTDHHRTLQRNVESARSDYRSAETQLQDLAGTLYLDPETAAARLLSVADEFGPAAASRMVREEPEQLGQTDERVSRPTIQDLAIALEDSLERTLDAQDALDVATRNREVALKQREPTRMQVLNINGLEFFVDVRRNELRSVDDPSQRYALGNELSPERANVRGGLLDRLAREAPTVKAVPTPGRGDKGRSR